MAALVFAGCFAAWTMVSVIGLQIQQELRLSDTQFSMLVASPLLSGALLRLPAGMLAERLVSRNLMLWLLVAVAVPLLLFSYAQYFWQYLLLGVAIGAAGSMFSIGVYFVSSRSSHQNQGLNLGIFGAGNMGAALTNLVVPMIILAYGWRTVPDIYALALLLLALFFWILTSPEGDQHSHRTEPLTWQRQIRPLADARVWRFGLYYFFMFGGYIALALWLPGYYMNHYGLTIQDASFLTLAFTLAGALSRILGGWFADHFGARQVNWSVFWVCLVCLFFLSYPSTSMTIHGTHGDISFAIAMPLWLFTVLVLVMGVAMGLGKASVLRVVYDYYPDRMGTVAGTVGMLGAIGGFGLLISFGLMADFIGVRSACFMLLYGLAVACMCVMYYGVSQEQKRSRLQEAIRHNFLHDDSELKDIER
ncbi:MAG: NarK/NasA family nitrate transporter [Gammaproteobacteria bacterium]|nr:NarK/NasA family nitrate transporter [Gammaproteobacteria bacterium]MCP4880892.1 NarK/NasA family nitrate transporter [Gammaproteobacteria bacterium]MDP6164510.1 nitrate/nitrite transporter [Gammaproteobacteria bacterium]